MKDPKLVTAIVLIEHVSDDGYSAEEKFFSAPPTRNPVGVLLDALTELTRMTALYGYAEQAKARFDKMQATMADFHARRKDGAMTEEAHPSQQDQREAICRAWNDLSPELRTSDALKPLWKAFQWSHDYATELREQKLVQITEANNYCRILSLIWMEEEGDPVAEVERLVAREEQPIALPEDIIVSKAMWDAGANAAREYFEETGSNNPAVIYRAMYAVALQEGGAK